MKMKMGDQRVLTVIVTGLLFAVLLLAGQEQTILVNGGKTVQGEDSVCVVIDAGHGGGR